MSESCIGVYGGTFDPVHVGHLRAASEIQKKLQLDEVKMVLSARPPHRHQPHTSADDRFSLLEMAVSDVEKLTADNCELLRDGPSYMVDTLAYYRQQTPDCSLLLILGIEAFNGLMSWHKWQDILQLAHVVVTDRAGFSNQLSDSMRLYVDRFITNDKSQLRYQTHGKIYSQPVEPVDVSATQIRQRIKNNISVAHMLPISCWEEIKQRGLYK
ncbi:MAG: nicotinate-nicotinamide nucleotide adenylyltransferase [Cycloclasticus sp.]|nr:MAG: nicotinate-nicotinamide nucleotide adenylyltransferase [Cycloclasticus sp.]